MKPTSIKLITSVLCLYKNCDKFILITNDKVQAKFKPFTLQTDR